MTDAEMQEGSDAVTPAAAVRVACFKRVCLVLVHVENRVMHALMTTQGELELGLAAVVIIIVLFVHSILGDVMGPVAILTRNLAGMALEAGKDIEEL